MCSLDRKPPVYSLSAGGTGVHIMAVCLLCSHPPVGGSAENSHRSWQTSFCKFSIGYIMNLHAWHCGYIPDLHTCIAVPFQISIHALQSHSRSPYMHCSPIPDLHTCIAVPFQISIHALQSQFQISMHAVWSHSRFSYMIFNKHYGLPYIPILFIPLSPSSSHTHTHTVNVHHHW